MWSAYINVSPVTQTRETDGHRTLAISLHARMNRAVITTNVDENGVKLATEIKFRMVQKLHVQTGSHRKRSRFIRGVKASDDCRTWVFCRQLAMTGLVLVFVNDSPINVLLETKGHYPVHWSIQYSKTRVPDRNIHYMLQTNWKFPQATDTQTASSKFIKYPRIISDSILGSPCLEFTLISKPLSTLSQN